MRSKLQPCDQGIIRTLKVRAILRNLIEMYPTLESRQYHTHKGELKIHKFAPNALNAMTFMTSALQTVTSTTIVNCFRGAGTRHEDPGFLPFTNPLQEITEILDVITVDMARIRSGQKTTLAAEVLLALVTKLLKIVKRLHLNVCWNHISHQHYIHLMMKMTPKSHTLFQLWKHVAP